MNTKNDQNASSGRPTNLMRLGLKQSSAALPSIRLSALAALTVAVLAACGGGSGSSDSNSAGSSNNTGSQSGSPAASRKASFLPPASTVQSVAATGDPIADSVAYLNAMRHNVGYTTALSVDKGLTTSSQNHAVYLADNSILSHGETAGLPGFTGAYPGDRIDKQGSYSTWGEVTSAGDVRAFTDSLVGVRGLFDAPYHRVLMLDNFASMGVGSASSSTWQAFNIDFGNETSALSGTQVIAYPYPNETDVPTDWYVNEIPSPFASAPQYNQTYTGYPITIQGNMMSKLSSVSYTVTDSGGNAVACQLQTSANDTLLTNAAMCVPFKPLNSNATYTVHVVGVLTTFGANGTQNSSLDLTWSFTTKAASTTKVQKLNGGGVRPPAVL
ncbi:CAP domain-containing protein [Caballeronia hypogeia]|uniref:CAP domain-containing protein n=1 Tax=Caballeronia hypogeia TaxID=1777140 RepID=UPI001E34FC9F|nr:CAP domain-containing protein [Caballeronia hypogeia]